MLTNLRYLVGCQNCGWQGERSSADVGCPVCQGFARTLDKWGTCPCGATVYCNRFTNSCAACGRDYNSSGQELAPRSHWGEETGESVSDILLADSNPWGGDY